MINFLQAMDVIARILLVSYFLSAGLTNIRQPMSILTLIKAKNIPLPMITLFGVFAVQIVGSLLVIFNWHATIGAIGLLAFTLSSNLLYCTFWTMEGLPKQLTKFLFSANIAVIGGLLLIIIAH